MPLDRQETCDVLVIGSGLAGLLAALRLTENANVQLVLTCKGDLLESNSSFAQGGLAAVTMSNLADSNEQHLSDTISSGAGLADVAVAARVIERGGSLIDVLTGYGVKFDTSAGAGYELALEGGHSQARVLHSKDTTGRAITTTLAGVLKARAEQRPNRVKIFERCLATELVMVDGSCVGARFLGAAQRFSVLAPTVILATGGVGQVFARTTNPSVATGDGIALAYRAGALLADMEFVQFHPTALCQPGAPAFLISEAVRGAGAVLVDANGRRFAGRFHKDAELATRDVVARAIHAVMMEQGTASVFLDLRPIGIQQVADRFPTIVDTCRKLGIDPLLEPIPVCPAAHYFMGGVAADVFGQTSVPGLFALGESACTGLHGANRLASNSLLEAGTMALDIAELLSSRAKSGRLSAISRLDGGGDVSPLLVPSDVSRFKTEMYTEAGLVRNHVGLTKLLEQPISATTEISVKTCVNANILTVGRLIAEAARTRQESRGAHFRGDYPVPDDALLGKRLLVSKDGFYWQDSRTPAHGNRSAAALSA